MRIGRQIFALAVAASLAASPAFGAGIVRPTPGSIPAWTSCGFTATDFNSLADGSVAVDPVAITQSTNLDDYLDVSFSLNVGGATTSGSYLSLVLLPLNQDGTTYGDGTTTGTTPPAASYWVTNAFVQSGVASGGTVVGSFPPVFIGNRTSNFEVAIVNHLGVALNSAAAAVVKCKTVNTNGNG